MLFIQRGLTKREKRSFEYYSPCAYYKYIPIHTSRIHLPPFEKKKHKFGSRYHWYIIIMLRE